MNKLNLSQTDATITQIVDDLVTASSTDGLSANQGLVLKGLIDSINTILTSDDVALDELQELVDFIKINKTTLDTLGISNIAGLQAALDGKAGKTSNNTMSGVNTFTVNNKFEQGVNSKIGASGALSGYFSVNAPAADRVQFSTAGTGAKSYAVLSSLLTAYRDFTLPNKNGTIALLDDLLTKEEELVGTATENAATTGTVNLDLATFSDSYRVLTGNTTFTVTNTPAVDKAFVKTLTIKSTTAETLTLPVSWIVVGEYVADGTENYFSIKFSNHTTAGAKVICIITQA